MILKYQHLDFSPDELFFCGRYSRQSFDFPPRFHKEIEIVLTEHGHSKLFCAGEFATIKTGDVRIIGSNVPHFSRNNPKDSTSPDWARAIVLVFSPDALETLICDSTGCADVKKFFYSITGGLILNEELKNRVTPILSDLIILKGLDRLISFLSLLNVFTKASKDDFRVIGEGIQMSEMHHQDMGRLVRALQYVRDNYEDEVTLADVANVAALAPASFSRFFHKKTGQRFKEYLISTRLTQAALQIIRTEDSITEICYACGFSNLSNFNRQFKRRFNLTPGEYRKINR